MRFSTGIVDQALAPARAFDGLDVGALDRDGLLAAQQAVVAVRRASELLLAALAGEIARRSAADAAGGGLARAEGFGSAPRLIAAATGASLADAHRLIAAGTALLESELPVDSTPLGGGATDGTSPPDSEPLTTVASALAARHIGIEAAALVRETLAKIADDGALEARLVAKARELSIQDLRRVCERFQATHDVVAWREREKRQYEARFATLIPDRDGMMLLTARLDPPSAAPVKAWLDAQVRDAFRRRRDDDDPAFASIADTRTAGQIRADALVSLARHGLACDEPTSGVSTTVVVRMGLEELRTGLGLGESDELTTPVSATALRCMAADAEVIPLVLGAEGEPLDLGRSRRLFSKAQRLALVERDGGCSWCHAPPSYCEAHHIKWWERDRGPTDLANGLLLCTSCHHRLHDSGWDVTVRGNRVWFVPPASVDPARTPRLGGRARLEGERPERVEGESTERLEGESTEPSSTRPRELVGAG